MKQVKTKGSALSAPATLPLQQQQKNSNEHNSSGKTIEEISIGRGGIKIKTSNLKMVAGIVGLGLLGYCIYKHFEIDKATESKIRERREASNNTKAEDDNHTDNKIKINDAKSKNTIAEGREAARNTMDINDNRTDNEIRKRQAMSDIRINEHKQMMELRHNNSTVTAAPAPVKKSRTLKGWIDTFHAKFPMPDYSSITFLASILDGCPDDFKDAMLIHSLTELGALAFSKVRAKYLDGQLHSSSLQTIVIGEFGSGKAKFLQLHNTLFDRIIKSDAHKIKFGSQFDIIQTAGINISQSKFYNVVQNNHEVHIYAIEAETSTVDNVFKKPNGLGFDYLRKAFHNEPIYQNNKAKDAVCGMFNVYLNYTFTGTPKAVASLIDEKEVEGGTASRICFPVIPEVGRKIPSVSFPAGEELKVMQDQIDAWRELYCYTTDNKGDHACQETTINLDYVGEALKEWLDQQYDLAEEEGNHVRKDVRARMATIAFHSAIPLAMMAGNPQPSGRKLRKTIIELTIYIANYSMERFLSMFSDFGIKSQFAEEISTATFEDSVPRPERRKLTDEEVEEWYYRRGNLDENGNKIGYGYIAKQLNVNKDSVVNSFKRYEKKMGLK